MKIDTRISPRFGPEKLSDGSIESKIDVYEDRLSGWLFGPAEELLKRRDWQFAALALLLTFVEQYAIFNLGDKSKGKSSTNLFNGSFRNLFPQSIVPEELKGRHDAAGFRRRLAKFMYERARCGIFHIAKVKFGIFVGTFESPLQAAIVPETGKIEGVYVDVPKFAEAVKSHFTGYVRYLRDPKETEVRARFLEGWKITHAGESLPPHIEVPN